MFLPLPAAVTSTIITKHIVWRQGWRRGAGGERAEWLVPPSLDSLPTLLALPCLSVFLTHPLCIGALKPVPVSLLSPNVTSQPGLLMSAVTTAVQMGLQVSSHILILLSPRPRPFPVSPLAHKPLPPSNSGQTPGAAGDRLGHHCPNFFLKLTFLTSVCPPQRAPLAITI